MNIYNITKGQKNVVIVLGVIIWLLSIGAILDGESMKSVLVFILTPLILVFYLLGWKNNKKKN